MSQFYKPQIFMKTFALICMMIGMGTLNAQQSENGTLIIAKIEGQVKFYLHSLIRTRTFHIPPG